MKRNLTNWKAKLWEKGRLQRYLSLFLVAVLVTTQCTQSKGVSLVTAQSTCTEHAEHDDVCGYVKAVTGVDCDHKCGEECQTEQLNCKHEHDTECGYVAAVEGTKCQHTCGDGMCNAVMAADEKPCIFEHSEEVCGCTGEENTENCTHVCEETVCGYAAAIEEVQCDHQHEETVCGYMEGTLEVSCNHICEEACYQTIETCQHDCTDGTCSFVEAVEGVECTHACSECEPTEDIESTEEIDSTENIVDLEQVEEAVMTPMMMSETDALTEESVEINETNFPDDAFRQHIENYLDNDGDGYLTGAELEITVIDLCGDRYGESTKERNHICTHTCENLKGLELFTNLTELYCNGGSLKELDVSGNENLVVLFCSDNELTVLNLENNGALEELTCANNELTELNVSRNQKLFNLHCYGNHLINLDITGLTVTYFNATGQTIEDFYMYQSEDGTWVSGAAPDTEELPRTFGTNTTFYKYKLMTTAGKLDTFRVNQETGYFEADSVVPVVNPVYFKTVLADGSRTLSGSFSYHAVSGNISATAQMIGQYEARELNSVEDLLTKGYVQVIGAEEYSIQCERFDSVMEGIPGKYAVTVSSGNYFCETTLEVAMVIDDTDNFPDETFQNYITEYIDIADEDGEKDGLLTVEERNAVLYIDLCGSFFLGGATEGHLCNHSCTSLQGIEYFPYLLKLFCSDGEDDEITLSELDVSKNPKLLVLECGANALTELDLSNNPELLQLRCWSNQLKTIDVRYNPKLTHLRFGYDEISDVDLSCNPKLEAIRCEYSALEELDLSNNPEIWYVEVCSNSITSIKFHEDAVINYFYGHDQRIENLAMYRTETGGLVNKAKNSRDIVRTFNVGTFIKENSYAAEKLAFFELDSGILMATSVAPSSGKFYYQSDTIVGTRTCTLSGTFNYTAEDLVIPDGYIEVNTAADLDNANQLITDGHIRVTGLPEEYTVECENFGSLQSGIPGEYTVTITYGSTVRKTMVQTVVQIANLENFSDANFQNHIATYFDTGDIDGYLTKEEIDVVKYIDLCGERYNTASLGTGHICNHSCTSLKGIEYFKNLEELYCNYGTGESKLKELNVSMFPKLKQLECGGNALETLSVVHNPKLQILRCQENQLTELNVNFNPKLTHLRFDRNQISTLNLSRNPALTAIRFEYNHLSRLDVSKCTEMSYFSGTFQTLSNASMIYNGTHWEDSTGLKFAPSFTKFYSGSGMANEIENFVIDAQTQQLTATSLATTIDPVYFKSTMIAPNGFECPLSGSFHYTMSGDMTATPCYMDKALAAEVLSEETDLLEYFDISIDGASAGSGLEFTISCENFENASEGIIGSYPVMIAYNNYSVATTLEIGLDISDGNHFIDTAFQIHIDTYLDTGAEDGFLTSAEIESVTVIDLCGGKYDDESYIDEPEHTCNHTCTDLTGIEYFVNLEELYCTYGGEGTKISQLNVSAFPKLTRLQCSGNEIENLDVTENENLLTLRCDDNYLLNLDLSGCTQLSSFSAKNQQVAGPSFIYNGEKWIDTTGIQFVPEVTTFYGTSAMATPLARFAVDTETNLLTATTLATTVEPVYFKTTLTTPNDMVCELSGSFSYTMSGTLSTEKCYIDVNLAHNNYPKIVAPSGLISYWVIKLNGIIITDNMDVECDQETFDAVRNATVGTYHFTIKYGSLETEAIMEIGLQIENGKNFLDKEFQTHLLEHFDKGEFPGFLTAEEISEIRIIDLCGKKYIKNDHSEAQHKCNHKYTSLKGIEYFTSLEELFCTYGKIAELNLSTFPNLTWLECDGNQLTELDVSQNPLLEGLRAGNNQLTSLDVSNNPELVRLRVINNKLTELNVKNNTNLAYLDATNNQLGQLDVSQNEKLVFLYCDKNSITSLKLNEKADIDEFFALHQSIANLPMYKNSDGIWVNTAMSSTDTVRTFDTGTVFKENIDAEESLSYFLLEEDGTLTATAEVPTSGTVFYAKNTTIGEKQYTLTGTFYYTASDLIISPGTIEVNEAKALMNPKELIGNYIEVTGTLPEDYAVECADFRGKIKQGIPGEYTVRLICGDIVKETKIELFVEIDNVDNFPDESFQTHISEYFDLTDDTGEKDGILTWDELKLIKVVDLCGKKYTEVLADSNSHSCSHTCASLKGIEYFINLEALFCNVGKTGYKLTELNVSKCPNLMILECGGNQIAELDVSQNPNLLVLRCYSNQLKSIDVENNRKLGNLRFDKNQVAELDLSHNVYLEALRCENNLLTELDLSNNINIWYLQCNNNYLETLDLSNNTKLTTIYCQNNSLTNVTLNENIKSTCSFNGTGQVINNLSMYPDGNGNLINELKNSQDVVRKFAIGTIFKENADVEEELSYFDLTENGKLIATSEAPEEGTFYFKNATVIGSKTYTLSGHFDYIASSLVVSDGYIEVNDAKNLKGDEKALVSQGYIEVNGNENTDYTIECTDFEEKVKEGIPGQYIVTIVDGETTKTASIHVVVQIQNATNFKDENFQNYLSQNYDIGEKEGYLTFEELKKIKEIDLSQEPSKEQVELTGMEYFTQLSTLKYNNSDEMSSLYIGTSTSLRTIEVCGNTKLTSMNVSGCSNLEKLICMDNELTSLDISNNANLKILHCSYNSLQSLELSHNTEITELFCDSNKLASLDVSNLTQLQNLSCAGNALTYLDVTQLPVLINVDASQQRIENLLMVYSTNAGEGHWRNEAVQQMDTVKTFHSCINEFKDSVGKEPLDFYLEIDGTLAATTILPMVEEVSFKGNLSNDGSNWILGGTFTYLPKASLTSANTLLFTSAELQAQLQVLEIDEAAKLNRLTDLINVTPAIEEVINQVVIQMDAADFTKLYNGNGGSYDYKATLTLAGNKQEMSGQIVVYADVVSMVEIPAVIELTRDYTSKTAMAESYVGLYENTETLFSGDVEIYADSSVTLKADGINDMLNVNAFKEHNGQDIAYEREEPLAILNDEIQRQNFKLISSDVTKLKGKNYTGTMEFTISYGESN